MSSAANQNVVRLRDLRSGEIVDQVASTLSSMANQLSDRVQNWGSQAKGVARNTDGYVRSSPWAAVGIVALAGLATGLLVSYSARNVRGRPRSTYDGYTNYDESSGG